MSETDTFWKSGATHKIIGWLAGAVVLMCAGGLANNVSIVHELKTDIKVQEMRVTNLIDTLAEIKTDVKEIRQHQERRNQ